ncbi:MAG: CIA30 family protein [Planctomycetota bacterium]|nr:CIA30 family protein [Planctomycetota bacterium]
MRNLPLLLLTACAVPAQQPEPLAAERALADFSKPGEGSRWRTVLDGVMGGRSTGSFDVRDGRMVFTGVLNTNGGGFSSVRRRGGLDLGVDGEVGVHLRVRGDGRKYTLRLRQPTAQRRYAASYRTQFETEAGDGWQDVYVPYSALRPTWRGRNLDLPPVDPSKVDELGVSIDDKIDGPFRIEIQQIRTYGAFDLGALRDARRPLVVFAANAQDPRAVQQLAAAQRDADGFEEREITLVVVYDDGAAFAGSRPLSVKDSAALRDRFARNRKGATDGFTALLIGKDGGVKRTAHEPLAAADLFAQIDQMPMRRREVRERRR